MLTAERLNRALETNRIARLRKSVASAGVDDSCVHYKVPWHEFEVIESSTIDMIFSQAVLEHVDDLGHCYDRMFQWLKPGGLIVAPNRFSLPRHRQRFGMDIGLILNLTWWLIRGRRPYPSIKPSPCVATPAVHAVGRGLTSSLSNGLPLPTKINEGKAGRTAIPANFPN